MTGTGYEVAILDGVVVDLADLRLSTFADGFFFGSGLFETLTVTAEGPQFLERHLARLRRSLDALPTVKRPPADRLNTAELSLAIEHGLQRAAARGGKRPDVVKITTSDGHVLVTFRDAPSDLALRQRAGIVVAALGENLYRAGDMFVNHKTISYIRCYSNMGDSPLFTNERGEVCESPTANVFVLLQGRVVTPPLSSPCLPGIIREVLLEAGVLGELPVVEQALPTDALASVEGAFLTNSLSIAVPVARLFGRSLAGSKALAEAARAVVVHDETRVRD